MALAELGAVQLGRARRNAGLGVEVDSMHGRESQRLLRKLARPVALNDPGCLEHEVAQPRDAAMQRGARKIIVVMACSTGKKKGEGAFNKTEASCVSLIKRRRPL